MKTIDYIYRFDPKNPSVKRHPPDAEAARKTLEDGNVMFSRWMESCRMNMPTQGTEPQYIVPCNGLEVGMARAQGEMPKAAPFAVVVGCSDARVPTEMIFGQGFNDLFVIRVAGNVLGDECLGSVLFTHQVSMPKELLNGGIEMGTHLAMAPTNPREFTTVAEQVAKRMLQNSQAAKLASAAVKANGQGDGPRAEEILATVNP